MLQVKDPVCGMMVDSSTTQWASSYHGDTYYFCAEECMRSFDAAPAEYAIAPALAADAPGEQHEPPFTVSGAMAAPKFGSAGRGGAEYGQLPAAHDSKG